MGLSFLKSPNQLGRSSYNAVEKEILSIVMIAVRTKYYRVTYIDHPHVIEHDNIPKSSFLGYQREIYETLFFLEEMLLLDKFLNTAFTY